jgi:hypothetical protein
MLPFSDALITISGILFCLRCFFLDIPISYFLRSLITCTHLCIVYQQQYRSKELLEQSFEDLLVLHSSG